MARTRKGAVGRENMIVLCVCLVLLTAWSLGRTLRPGVRKAEGASGHPESMTEVLEPDAEEYLAWLADRHWPHDEYLDLERQWLAGLDALGEGPAPGPYLGPPPCPGCHRHGEDVWPCRMCGRLLHAACGHGMRRRRVPRPYRTRDMQAEVVIAEWICTNCSSVVGLDLDENLS